jgi:hypothetical protein
LRAHDPRGRPRAVHYAEQVHRDVTRHLLVRDRVEGAGVQDARVVDVDVEAAVGAPRLLDEPGEILRPGHIGHNSSRVGLKLRDLFDGALQALAVGVAQ